MTTEFRVLNKHLMLTRWTKTCAWRVEANIFELVKHYIIWSLFKLKPSDLPLFPPFIDETTFPELKLWYLALSKPNPPQVRRIKTTDELYLKWLQELDLSKKFNQAECDHYFVDEVSARKAADVDAVAIEESINEGAA